MRYFDCEICDMHTSALDEENEIPKCDCRKPMQEIFPFAHSESELKAMVADQRKIAKLSSREQKMLSMRAGIDGETKEFEDIAKVFGISPIRCIAIFCRTVNKL